EGDRAADQQPAQDRRARGARPEDHQARADRAGADSPQSPLPRDQARQARASARPQARGDVMREIAPEHDAQGCRFALVASRFHEDYVRRLAEAAEAVLVQRGAAAGDVERWWVPGSFELPLACRWAAASGRFDAVIA